jgi:hypothetical protein
VDKNEIIRIIDVEVFPYEGKCAICGKKFEMRFNGGELDYHSCCGYDYYLEHARIDFVVRKRDKNDR